MFFYQTPEVYFLFESWHITKNGPYIASVIATIFIGILMELVTYGVSYLKAGIKTINPKTRIGDYESLEDANSKCHCSGKEQLKIQWGLRLIIAIAYTVQLFLAYLIMMIAMTYNVVLLLAPVLGMVIGYMAVVYLQKIQNKN